MAAECSSRSITGSVVDRSLSVEEHFYEANLTIPVRRLGHRGLSKQRAVVSPLNPSSKTGDVFTAVVTGLIAQVGGEVVVPSGVAARGQVIGVKANKKATDKARLKLALTSLTIDGTTYSIQTKLVTTKAQDNSKSTTATTSGELGASAESGLVFKLTAPVTVNRQRNGGTGQQS